jgi:hypothetical protein
VTLLGLALGFPAIGADDSRHMQFDEQVAPLLIKACLDCHSGPEPGGGLDLSRRESAMTGGDSGAVLRPADPEGSALWRRVRDGEMPPKEPLSSEEREVLRRWITDGARWGTDPIDPFRATTAKRAGYDWWSLQPLGNPEVPRVDHPRVRNEIDRFVVARLQATGLEPAEEASRRTLIRRLSFDLLGLPPTREEVAEFESDLRPDAYERLVDRLLGSPHYGVRWGRHWLDVARFGESQGFERDKLRENAWPYRDWVIDSLNADLSYDAFARRQIAGDVLAGAGIDGVIATGFLVAGPWDEVGQNQQSAAMKAVVRQDELEDYVSVVGQTFLGLTVHCARCHDHKFDPIRQEEYYRLAAALDGVRHGSRDVMSDDDQQRKAHLAEAIAHLEEARNSLRKEARKRIIEAQLETAASTAIPFPIARWTFDGGLRDTEASLHGTATGGARIKDGSLRVDGKNDWAASAPLPLDLEAKTLEAWVRLENLDQRGGAAISVESLDGSVFDAIVFGEREPKRWMAGSDNFRRTQSFNGAEEAEAVAQTVHVAIIYAADGTISGYRNGEPYGTSYRTEGPVKFATGQARVLFGLRHSPPGGGKHLAGAIDAAQLYDRALTADQVRQSWKAGPEGIQESSLQAALSSDEQRTWRLIEERLDQLREEHDAIQPMSVYAAKPEPPGVSHLLIRGNTSSPAREVTPGGIASIGGISADFKLPSDAPDAARRRELADWITHPENPLFARVLVNRVWHYHFGAGLVKSPSDFGFNGGRPSHPELLDWLAREFQREGYSLKALHRLIVTSATYRQSSARNRRAATIDADNRLLWRMSPRRIEAEELRDAVLQAAGSLNREMGGPGYRDFETFTRNTQFYEIRDVSGAAHERRTIYRTWIRSARSPLLDVFDCPDPSTKTPDRAVTVTPLQALSLMNNAFMLRMSSRFADRLRTDAGEDAAEQASRAFQIAYGRDASPQERAQLSSFIEQHGLAELCRVILNSNEFLYVE